MYWLLLYYKKLVNLFLDLCLVNKKPKIACFEKSGFYFAGSYFTANASKLIEKCFLDLRNIFLNQENIRKFFSK